MQTRFLKRLVDALTTVGWKIEFGAPDRELPARLDDYSSVREFALKVRRCVSPAEDIWFLGSDDFIDDSGDGWNFLEQKISLATAEGDQKWIDEIEAFWWEHLPVAISVRGEYSYLSMDRKGRIWAGVAPELENPVLVSASFAEFVEVLEKQALSRSGMLYDDWIGPPR